MSAARRLYLASHIKRTRATRAAVEQRRSDLYDIVAEIKPTNVRAVFYQAGVRGIVEKTEAGYTRVQTDLVLMRRSGELPYDWLTDNTRWQRKPRSYNSITAALEDTANHYRKALWANTGCYAEMWLEKDALAGVILPVTALYDVPLMVARGYASLSFLYEAAEHIASIDIPAYIYHLGDYDPSGVNAGEKIEQTLRELAPNAEIHFERLAVLPKQIERWNLPTRPTKQTDSRAKSFGEISVELDAINPNQLRRLVRSAVERHLPPDRLEVLQAAEENERGILFDIVAKLQKMQ